MTGYILMLKVMETYGWDFQTYERQPAWVIDLAIRRMDIEAKLERQAQENTTHA